MALASTSCTTPIWQGLLLMRKNPQTSRSHHTATTPARLSGYKIRRQRGNLANGFGRQTGQKYDVKKVRNT